MKRKGMGCCGVIAVILLLGVLFSPKSANLTAQQIAETMLSNHGTANAPTESPTLESPTQTSTPSIDNSVKAIMDGTGLNQADAEKAFEVIKSVGFEQVYEMRHTLDIETMKGYLASLGYTIDFNVTFEGNEIFGISSDEIVFYDRDAGGVLDRITNYILTAGEKGEYQVATQVLVQEALKAPSTAVFQQSQWNIVRERDIVWVQAYVDAQNSFGAQIRSPFTAQWSHSTGNILYLEIDGQVVYGSAQTP
ncbi:MAG: hypothetical protein WEC16_00220 [Anaerolineales bacterium]